VSTKDSYQDVVGTEENELPGNEMRMNRRVWNAIRAQLGNDLPSNIYSLPEFWAWLSDSFASDTAKRADKLILALLESEGFFRWYEELGNQRRALCEIFHLAALEAGRAANERQTEETRTLLNDLLDSAELGEVSLKGRRDTRDSYQRLASDTGLSIFQHLSQKYQDEYDDAERLHNARKRLIVALRQMTR